jgi:Arc/MetJ family transcription regulator
VTKTLLDLDDELLAEATIALGATTKKDAVTRALREVVEARRRQRATALAELQRLADEGAFHFERLAELDQ